MSSLIALGEEGREQRNHDLMMAGDCVSATAALSVRAVDDIGFGSVVLEKVEVDGSKVLQFVAEIPHDTDRLQKDLRQDDGRAHIHIDAPVVKTSNEGAAEAEIVMSGCADCGAEGTRVGVWSIGANCDVDRHG